MKYILNIVFSVVTLQAVAQSSEVRFSVAIQESLITQYSESYVIDAFKSDYEFFEESITNAIDYWDMDASEVLKEDYTGTQTLKIVNIDIIPDSLFETTPLSTGVFLNRFSSPNDGWYDDFSPDSLCLKVNQARTMYILDNSVTNTSGTASVLASVIRWSAVDPMFSTHITAHELAHMFFALHNQAVQLNDFVTIQGDTIAKPNDWTLINGVGPYQPILSISSVDTILNSILGRGIISSRESHPNLELSIINQADSIVNAGDTIMILTEIHESWTKTNPVVFIKDSDGNILLTSIHNELVKPHEIVIPNDVTEVFILHLTIANEYSSDSDSLEFKLIINESTVSVDIHQSNQEFSVYPNPSNNTTKIDFEDLTELPKSISIYTESGSLINIIKLENKREILLNTKELIPGTYFIAVKFQDSSVVTRMLNVIE